MKYLYYCNSAYQLLNILNLHCQRKNRNFENLENYSADLLVLNAFKGAKDLAELVEKQNLFTKVRIISKTKDNSGSFHQIKSFLDIALPGNYIKSKYRLNPNEHKGYDVLVVPKFSRVTAAIWQLNKKAELQLFEDGLATYYFDYDLVVPRSRSYKTLYKTFNAGRDFLDFSKVYVSSPDLYTGDYKERVAGIPELDDELKNTFSELFRDFSGMEKGSDKKIIYFSQSMFKDEEVLEHLANHKDDVLFCPHPRDPKVNEVFEISSDKQIWEIRAMSMKDIENCCLIAIHSTALMTPKMLFDKEPYLIFVYYLMPLFYEVDFFDGPIKEFINSYRNPEKIMIPKTMEEFDVCLKKVKERTVS